MKYFIKRFAPETSDFELLLEFDLSHFITPNCCQEDLETLMMTKKLSILVVGQDILRTNGEVKMLLKLCLNLKTTRFLFEATEIIVFSS